MSKYNAVSALINLGASKAIVEPVMSRASGCFVGTVGGHQIRIITKHGRAVSIMASRDAADVADAIRTHIGAIRCEMRLLGA
jgi:hypothetical protein